MQENTALFEFDAQIAAQGYPLVCGVDEAQIRTSGISLWD